MVVISVAGSLGGLWLLLKPTIAIEPTSSVDRSQSLATQLKITNAGNVPVYDVHFRCEYGSPLGVGGPGLDMTGSTFGPARVLSRGASNHTSLRRYLQS